MTKPVDYLKGTQAALNKTDCLVYKNLFLTPPRFLHSSSINKSGEDQPFLLLALLKKKYWKPSAVITAVAVDPDQPSAHICLLVR